MILIKPVIVNDVRLISSSIPEPDASQGEVAWVAGTYALGDRAVKISTHSIYEVVADPSTTDDPEVGVLKSPQTWVRVSPTNRYKMFDTENNTGSVGVDIEVVVSPVDETINSLSCFATECTEVVETAYDNAGNQTYTNTIEMKSRGGDANWYDWLFAGFVLKNKFVDLDIPSTGRGSLKVLFSGAARVGTFTIGTKYEAGTAQHGTGAQLLDYSIPEEDGFGGITYSSGFNAKLVNYDILADTSNVDAIFDVFTEIGKTPTVFMGNKTGSSDMTLVYGIVRDFSPTYTGFTKSKIDLTVTGLV